MLIARTQEESEQFIELGESHILRLEEKPVKLLLEGIEYLIDNENQRLVFIPDACNQQSIKTRSYGTLAYFENIKDFIESKYNKCVIALYCGSTSTKQVRKNIVVTKTLESKTDSYFFDDRENTGQNTIEFFATKDYEFNKIKEVEPKNAYLFVLSRNKYSQNGVQIINNYLIKSKN